MKVIVKNEFINIMLKDDQFLGTDADRVIQMFGCIVQSAFLCDDEQGFRALFQVLALHAQNEIKRITANRPEWEQGSEET